MLGYGGTNNRIVDVTVGATTIRQFVHDAAGNITSDTRLGSVYAYTYNNAGRLTTVSLGGTLKGTYTFNGREQLVSRVVTNSGASNGTTHFVHDRMGNVIAEADGSGVTQREYIWLPETQTAATRQAYAQVDRPVAVIGGGQTYMVHVDHLNRPIKMTDGSKASVWDAIWAPWGGAHSITGSATLDTRFPGQWFQLESGLHYNWHRHYDPSIGRYTRADPLGFVDGPSVYAYARGNPQSFVDPDGRFIQLILPCFANPACARAAITGIAAAGAAIWILTQDQPKICVPNFLNNDKVDPNKDPKPAAPAVPGNPWHPSEVDKRRSKWRQTEGAKNLDPDPSNPIPDRGPGRNLGGHESKHVPHSPGQRNVGAQEEHSIKPKGGLRPR